MKRKTYILIGLLLISAIVFVVIYTKSLRKLPYEADVSDIEIEPLQINRFEKVLFNINPFKLRQELDPYIEKYKFFLGDEIDNPLAKRQLYDYITDPAIIDLYNETMIIFPDLNNLEEELTEAFTYYSYHFPENEIPETYSYVSGLDISNPIKYNRQNLAIALDTYLGEDFKKYTKIGIPKYQLMKRSPEFITRDVIYTIAKNKTENNFNPETLIEHMIYKGIKLYFLDCMMPHTHDTIKIAYTSKQEKWMKHNQGHVWSYILNNELLFSSNRSKINNFITDAPFTAAFSRKSPPRVAVWIGWQIVREYMRRNSDVELNELIHKTDAENILVKSRYKP